VLCASPALPPAMGSGAEAPLLPPADGPQAPPQPWYTFAGWRAVHISVAAATALIVVGTVIARLDAYEWQRHHIAESEYTTFLFPCEARRWRVCVCELCVALRCAGAGAGGGCAPAAVICVRERQPAAAARWMRRGRGRTRRAHA
jgi:hypothetical protein